MYISVCVPLCLKKISDDSQREKNVDTIAITKDPALPPDEGGGTSEPHSVECLSGLSTGLGLLWQPLLSVPFALVPVMGQGHSYWRYMLSLCLVSSEMLCLSALAVSSQVLSGGQPSSPSDQINIVCFLFFSFLFLSFLFYSP